MIKIDSFTNPSSFKEMSFKAIKAAILSGELKAETIYNIDEFAKSFGISKTPVREALIDLADRGFVTFIPHRGIKLNTFDAKGIRNLYEIRGAIEITAIQYIHRKISDGSIEELENLNKSAKEFIDKKDPAEFVACDRDFHFYLAELTDNAYFVSFLERVRDLIDWMGTKALLHDMTRMTAVYQEHQKVIDGLKAKNIEGAKQAMAEHIHNTMNNVLEQWNNK